MVASKSHARLGAHGFRCNGAQFIPSVLPFGFILSLGSSGSGVSLRFGFSCSQGFGFRSEVSSRVSLLRTCGCAGSAWGG